MRQHLCFLILILTAVIGVNSVLALETGTLGGVPNPSEEILRAMDNANYILHAKDSKLTQVPVYKVKLDHNRRITPQSISVRRDPSTGEIYVYTGSKMHKSADGGLTWSSHAVSGGPTNWAWQILTDGTFVGTNQGGYSPKDAAVVTSADKGRTWKKIGTIPRPTSFDSGSGAKPYTHWDSVTNLFRFPCTDRLLWAVRLHSDAENLHRVLVRYDSTDGGKNWAGPTLFTTENYNHPGPLPHPMSEGGIAKLPSGNLLAVLRYRRLLFPTDPNGTHKRGYKNCFLMDSTDNGASWHNLRPLTTVYGQTYGYPAVLSDGTVIVIHDTRYGPGKPGARAMVSYDEGQTWENQVYYLDVTNFHGAYTQSVVLEDDTIVTISATSDAGNNWEIIKDKVDIHAIRWKPVKKQAKSKCKITKYTNLN